MNRFLVYSAIMMLLGCAALKALPVALVPDATMPDPRLTPGAWNPSGALSCGSGATRGERQLSRRVSVRRWIFGTYHVPYDQRTAYELDHLVPLCLGGEDEVANLWPEQRAGVWGAAMKDRLERCACRLACEGRADAESLRRAIAANWHTAYELYVPLCGPKRIGGRR